MHPHNEHRQHKVERRRVASMLKGYASGGAVHDDEAEDKALIRKTVRKSALKMHGEKGKHRADRMARARGGRTNKKGTNVTVVVAPQGGAHAMPPMPGAGAPPVAPAMPPRPPMIPPPGAMPPPGMPPGMPPGGPPGMMPPRHAGGRTYASGGRVKDGPAWKEGLRAGTQVENIPGKNDGKDIGRPRPITYKTGGKVEAPKGIAPATKLPGGAGGGEARLKKEARARRDYAAA